jgi:predicted RNA binding protein YcfA (HicA-like mRNA interferase family)
MKYREIRKIVIADGWIKVRQSGSHEIYRHHRKPGTVTIAGHDRNDVPEVILKSILFQAGLKR